MTLVLVETSGGVVAETSLEALTLARGLAESSAAPELTAVVVGPVAADTVEALTAELGAFGVSRILHGDDARLSSYGAGAWAATVVAALERAGAAHVVAAGTPRGNEVMAHVATRLDVPMAANVVAVADPDPLLVSRQVMGGLALEEMLLPMLPAVLTVAGHAVTATPASAPTQPAIEAVSPSLSELDLATRVVSVEQTAKADTAGLTSARVVVGGGRGAGSADGFRDLVELADLLGGAVGVSRVVTSLGWRPHSEQVGQTGSRIAPDVYIACGISGAIQHWAGCSTAKTIVAINTDRDAPMVTRAHYAVIGDMHEIVPAVNEELRRRGAASAPTQPA